MHWISINKVNTSPGCSHVSVVFYLLKPVIMASWKSQDSSAHCNLFQHLVQSQWDHLFLVFDWQTPAPCCGELLVVWLDHCLCETRVYWLMPFSNKDWGQSSDSFSSVTLHPLLLQGLAVRRVASFQLCLGNYEIFLDFGRIVLSFGEVQVSG